MLSDIFAVILAVLIFGGSIRYLFAFIRYMRSGQYEVDKRFWEITR